MMWRTCPICKEVKNLGSSLQIEIWDTMDEVDQAWLFHNPIAVLQAYWDMDITAEPESICRE